MSKCGLRIKACCRNKYNKCNTQHCIIHYFYFNSQIKPLYVSNKTECFSYRGGCGVMCIEAFKRRFGLGIEFIGGGSFYEVGGASY